MGKGAEGARQLGCSLASDSEMATWTSLTGFLFYNVLPTIMMNWMTFLIIAILLVVFALFKERILLGLAGDRKFHGDVLSCMKGALVLPVVAADGRRGVHPAWAVVIAWNCPSLTLAAAVVAVQPPVKKLC